MFEADRFDVFEDDDEQDDGECPMSGCERCQAATSFVHEGQQLRLTIKDGELVAEDYDENGPQTNSRHSDYGEVTLGNGSVEVSKVVQIGDATLEDSWARFTPQGYILEDGTIRWFGDKNV